LTDTTQSGAGSTAPAAPDAAQPEAVAAAPEAADKKAGRLFDPLHDHPLDTSRDVSRPETVRFQDGE